MILPSQTLKSALTVIGPAVGRRVALPCLTHTLLEADDEAAQLRATDLEISISCRIPGATLADLDTALLPWELLRDLTGSWPAGDATFRPLDATPTWPWRVGARCGPARATIHGLDPFEFPREVDMPAEAWHDVPVAALSAIADRVAFAASSDESRVVLTGVRLSSDGRQLTGAAVDGFRLAMIEQAIPEGRPFAIIVPARAVGALGGLLAKSTAETVRLAATDAQVVVEIGEVPLESEVSTVELRSQLIAGVFPDYRSIIPKDRTARVTVSAAALTAALGTVGVLARTEAKQVHVTAKADELTLWTEVEAGSARSTIDATLTGEPFEMMLNGRMLSGGLAAAGGEWVTLDMAHPTRPIVLRAAEPDGWLYVQMPMILHAKQANREAS